jgi:hypothetical protein
VYKASLPPWKNDRIWLVLDGENGRSREGWQRVNIYCLVFITACPSGAHRLHYELVSHGRGGPIIQRAQEHQNDNNHYRRPQGDDQIGNDPNYGISWHDFLERTWLSLNGEYINSPPLTGDSSSSSTPGRDTSNCILSLHMQVQKSQTKPHDNTQGFQRTFRNMPQKWSASGQQGDGNWDNSLNSLRNPA